MKDFSQQFLKLVKGLNFRVHFFASNKDDIDYG